MSKNQIEKGAPKLPERPWAFVAYFIKFFSLALIAMVIFEAGQKICQILVPYAFKEILDRAIAFNGPTSELTTHLSNSITFFVAISIGTLLFARASGGLLVYVGPALRKRARETIYHFLQHHSHRYFISHFAGSLANRINEVSMSVNHGMWTVLFDFWPVTISFGTTLYLLYGAHYQLAIYLGGWIFAYVAVSFYLANRCKEYARKFAAARSKTTGHIVDAVTNVMNTKMFATLPYERSRLSGQLTQEMKEARATIWFMEKMRWFQFTAALILQVGLILYALKLFARSEISIGNFAMVASLGLLVIEDAKGLSRRFLEFFEYLGNITDGVRILIGPHEIVDRQNAKNLQVSGGQIRFDSVTFSYHEKAKVFENLNVTIEPGQKVGLVGFSGSGKSTFANLLLRLFEPQNGHIFIDGQSISECTQDSLRQQVSMIPQDPILFHRTLKENIRYGRLEATDDMVIEAAKQANAHQFIEKTPQAYEALVGERGVKLSGGQRQRIAIARAILKNAPILILDEATSSLDSVTERAIQRAFEVSMKDKTVIVIAHRLSTIAHLDRILVFHNGQIIEDGSHDRLIAKNGHYALMWNMQAGGFLPESEDQVFPEVRA